MEKLESILEKVKREYEVTFDDKGNMVLSKEGTFPYRVKGNGEKFILYQAYSPRVTIKEKWLKIKDFGELEDVLKMVIKRHNKAVEYMDGWNKI